MPIHLATSRDIGSAVRRTLGLPVPFVPDNLLLGPCATDPEIHEEARSRYWDLDRGERARFHASSRAVTEAIASRSRVILWTSRLWSDVAALWSLCAWRLLCRPLEPKIDLITVGSAEDHAFGRGTLRVTTADVRRHLDTQRPLSLTRVREMALFWRALASRTPILAARGRRGGPEREDLQTIGTYQAGFFPRREGSRLALSRFDDLLLTCLGDDWATAVDPLRVRSAVGKELWKWIAHTGDFFPAMRLRAWAEHEGAEAALERRPYRPERPMQEWQYRLSAVGKRIQREGLDDVARGAPLVMGGATAYDPAAPWVVVEEGSDRPTLRQMP